MDSSALVKLVAAEPQSDALFEFIADRSPVVSSALARVELLRAVKRAGDREQHKQRAEQVLASIALLRIDDGILGQAARLEPLALRTLDAVHLATAMVLGADLATFVAYDRQLLEAARAQGLKVVAPGLEKGSRASRVAGPDR